MRITIDIDTQGEKATVQTVGDTAQPSGEDVNAGGPPASLLEALGDVSADQGTEAGAPPAELVAALVTSASNGSNGSLIDAGAAPSL